MKKFMFLLIGFGNIFAMEPASPSRDDDEMHTREETIKEMRASLVHMRIEIQPLIEETLRKLAIPEWTKGDHADRLLEMHQAIKDRNLAGIDETLLRLVDNDLEQKKVDVRHILLDDRIYAIRNRQEPKKYLIVAKAESTPLSEAINLFQNDPSFERLEIIKFLLAKQRLDVVLPNNSSYLHLAIALDLPQIACLIITEIVSRYGTEAKSLLQIPERRSDSTPLHYACARYDDQTVKRLIDMGIDLQPEDGGYRTPLHFLYDADRCPASMDILDLKKIAHDPALWANLKQKMNTIIDLFAQKGITLSVDSLDIHVQHFWRILETIKQEDNED